MLKYRQIEIKEKKPNCKVKSNDLNPKMNLQKLKIKVKLFPSNKKDDKNLSKSLLLDKDRTQKEKIQLIEKEKLPKKNNSQIKRYINKNNNNNLNTQKQKQYYLSAEKRKINNKNKMNLDNISKKKNFIKSTEKRPIVFIKQKKEDVKNNNHIYAKKESNNVKIKKMNLSTENVEKSKFHDISKKVNSTYNSSHKTKIKIINSSFANKNEAKIIKKKIINEKEKNLIKSKLTFEKIQKNKIKKIQKNENFNNRSAINRVKHKVILKEIKESNGNNKIKKSKPNFSSSDEDNTSSGNESDYMHNLKKYRYKRNITDIFGNDKINRKISISSKNVNESIKILEFKNQNNPIIKNNKYLRRRSLDNKSVREKLEQYMNKMMLKQNGGSTLFLTNYEIGSIYEKEINIFVNEKKFQKKVKICSCTKAGTSGPGIVKQNQDSFFIKENFMENDSYFFIGVCDGHGDDGEQISNLVSNKLQNYIFSLNNEDIISNFKKINSEIYLNPDINSDMSGTTVVSLIITQKKLISINLGDSRLTLFKYDNGIYYSKNLSREHKPSEIEESKRIISSGGIIKKCFDEKTKKFFGPERVWLKNKDEPGLAMTRSLGDKTAHNIGVSDEPEIKKFFYDGTEKFIIIASDGLWEYISGEQCINIVKKYYEEEKDPKEAAMDLTKEAFKKWKRKGVVIDDITVIVIFFY